MGRSGALTALIAAGWLVGTMGAAAPKEVTLPVVELRQYTLHPGQRDVLVNLFETEFIESQEAVGMKVLGQFRDLDAPDRFVWIRGFMDLPSRANALNAFYNGPVWQAHRDLANSTIADSDNVLLLRAARPGSGFIADGRPRPPRGARAIPEGLIVATIYYFDAPIGPAFVEFFETVVTPRLGAAGLPILASFVTETGPNNYPRLPVRDHDHVFVWFTRVVDAGDYAQRLTTLGASSAWRDIAYTLRGRLRAQPEVLRLQPTPRSQLHD